ILCGDGIVHYSFSDDRTSSLYSHDARLGYRTTEDAPIQPFSRKTITVQLGCHAHLHGVAWLSLMAAGPRQPCREIRFVQRCSNSPGRSRDEWDMQRDRCCGPAGPSGWVSMLEFHSHEHLHEYRPVVQRKPQLGHIDARLAGGAIVVQLFSSATQ